MADELRDQEQAPPPSMAETLGMEINRTKPTPGLSHSPGLRELPDSPVPQTLLEKAIGAVVRSHVHGPQQAPVDPVAAGLDMGHQPMSRAENRAITLTGSDASGPHTYPVDAPNTHETVPAAPDVQHAVGEAPAAAPVRSPASDEAETKRD